MTSRCNNNPHMTFKPFSGLQLVLVLWALSYLPSANAESVSLESWVNPFELSSAKRILDYQWEEKASGNHRICAFIPRSETSYWFAVNYGLVKKARELGISLKVFHTAELPQRSPEKLKEQIDHCIAHRPNSVIVDDTFGDELVQLQRAFSHPVKIIAVGKNLLLGAIDASSSPSFTDIGQRLAKYMNQKHDNGRIQQTVLFPGDRKMQYVSAFIDGFIPKINGHKFHLRDTIYTSDNYLEIKSALTRYLNANLDTSIIVGSGLVAQAAVEVLHEMSLTGDVQIISYELSAQIYRNIKRGKIDAAITAPPVIQGLLAVDMALKLQNKTLSKGHVSPAVELVDTENLPQFDISRSFAPYGYRETLEVN